MKLSVLGIIMLLVPLGHAAEQGGAGRGEGQGTNKVSTPIDLSTFATDVPTVEIALAKATGYRRENALAMFGRSSAASGRFDVAAAAYAMFLNEFGRDHPHSEKIAVRLADCLFPFKYDQIDVLHSAAGPKLEPAWRMGYSPRPEHLRRAVHALELAGSLAQDEHAKGSALLKLGWVHRVLGDWDASTAAWDRCAKDAAPTKSSADALWLAAENLEWTSHPSDAAERLKQLAHLSSDDGRASAIGERIEQLDAEARRSSEWFADPVVSLQSEIEARSKAHSPQGVYRSVVRWLQQRGERSALIVVSRWACGQTNWPERDRVRACFDLADALLDATDPGGREEAVQRLREIVELTSDDATAVHAAMRCCRVLSELQRLDEADRMMETIVSRVRGSKRWEPMILTRHAESLLKRGEKEQASRVLVRLNVGYPDYGLSESLEALQNTNRAEGGR